MFNYWALNVDTFNLKLLYMATAIECHANAIKFYLIFVTVYVYALSHICLVEHGM